MQFVAINKSHYFEYFQVFVKLYVYVFVCAPCVSTSIFVNNQLAQVWLYHFTDCWNRSIVGGYSHCQVSCASHISFCVVSQAFIMNQIAAVIIWVMEFWWLAMDLMEMKQMAITTGWSRTGINCHKNLYRNFRS